MAGDWIKMRIDLQSHPKVVRILSAMQRTEIQKTTDKFRVIGGLHAVWSVFDTHSTDGALSGYTPDLLDHIVGMQGIAQAMVDVGWLMFDGAQTIVMPEFAEHNGKSGKRRAEDQKRKRDGRKCPQSVRNLSANEADENRTREEKRREEKSVIERGDSNESPQPDNKPSRGTRLHNDWKPTPANLAYIKEKRPDLNPEVVAERFRNHWLAQAGQKGVKLDWDATWRNWCLSERATPITAPQASQGQSSLYQQNMRNAALAKKMIFGNQAQGEIIDHE